MNIEQLSLIASVLSLAGTMIGYTDNMTIPDQGVELVQEDKIQPFKQLNRYALAKHANATVETTQLESEYGGHYTYQVELRDAQGIQWEVELDATNGEIIRDQQDD